MFTLTPDDLELIEKLEVEFDPATHWADNPVREWVPKSKWDKLCQIERDHLKRSLRWAVVFRDMQRLNETFGARGFNHRVFHDAFYDIINEGARGPATRDDEEIRHLIADGLTSNSEGVAFDAMFWPSPSDAACKRVLGGFLTYP